MDVGQAYDGALQRAANLTLSKQESKAREIDLDVRQRAADDDLLQRNNTKNIQEAMAAGYKDWLAANPDALSPGNKAKVQSPDGGPAYTMPVTSEGGPSAQQAAASLNGASSDGFRSPVDKMDGYLAGLDAGVSAALKTGNNDLVRKQFAEAQQLRGAQIQKSFQQADRDFSTSGDPNVYVAGMNKYAGEGGKIDNIKSNPDGTFTLTGTDVRGQPKVHTITTQQFQQSMDVLRDPQRFLDARMKGLEMSLKAQADAAGKTAEAQGEVAAKGLRVAPGETLYMPGPNGEITRGRSISGGPKDDRYVATSLGQGSGVVVDKQTGATQPIGDAPGGAGTGKPLNAQQILTAKEKAGAVVRALRGNPIQGFDESSQVSTAKLSARASEIIDEQNAAGTPVDPDVAANMAYDEMVRKKKLAMPDAPLARKSDAAPDPTKIPFFRQR
jgi:hypothetical protein